MYRKFPEQETHTPHKQCYVTWKSLQNSLLEATGVDGQLQKQVQKEAGMQSKILERLLDVTFHLASRNLAFRDKTTNLDDVHNGHFLGTHDLLAQYDPLLHEHLEKVRQKKKASRLTHYPSPESQNKFIELCSKRVLNTILEERRNAICDSTPDISHIEQNVLLIRCVHHDKEGSGVWKIVKRFIEFKDLNKKTGQEISQMIIETLQSTGIHLQDCRGQGYDNGANMSGKVKGVQALISKANPLATFSPCASDSLNLVGVHAAESCPEISKLFGSVNRLYNFFSASPERWATFFAPILKLTSMTEA